MPLTRSETEARCGFTIPDGIWKFTPWGNRIVVRRLPPQATFGQIEIPISAQRMISAGHIVEAGEGVGQLNDLPGQALLPRRFYLPDGRTDLDALIGLVVTFTHWGGEAIKPSAEHSLVESDYDTEYLLIQAVDIWGDNEPEEPPAEDLPIKEPIQ